MSLEGKVNIHVREGEFDYTVFLTNNHHLPAHVIVDFGESENLKLIAKESKQVGPMQVEVNIQPGVQRAEIAVLDQINRSANVRFHYKTQMLQEASSRGGAAYSEQPSGDEEDDISEVAEGLSLIVRSVSTGYRLFVKNVHASTKYEIAVDIGESKNLKLLPDDAAKLLDRMVVSTIVGPKSGFVPLANCPVDDMSKGECEVRYKIRARVSQ